MSSLVGSLLVVLYAAALLGVACCATLQAVKRNIQDDRKENEND